MEIEITNEEKNNIELKTDNLTVAELLRSYLNKQGVEFAAWKREHPSKPVIFSIETSGKTVKKSVSEAIIAIKKDLKEITDLVK